MPRTQDDSYCNCMHIEFNSVTVLNKFIATDYIILCYQLHNIILNIILNIIYNYFNYEYYL